MLLKQLTHMLFVLRITLSLFTYNLTLLNLTNLNFQVYPPLTLHLVRHPQLKNHTIILMKTSILTPHCTLIKIIFSEITNSHHLLHPQLNKHTNPLTYMAVSVIMTLVKIISLIIPNLNQTTLSLSHAISLNT